MAERQESYERGVHADGISVGICLSVNFDFLPEKLRNALTSELDLFTQKVYDLVNEEQ